MPPPWLFVIPSHANKSAARFGGPCFPAATRVRPPIAASPLRLAAVMAAPAGGRPAAQSYKAGFTHQGPVGPLGIRRGASTYLGGCVSEARASFCPLGWF